MSALIFVLTPMWFDANMSALIYETNANTPAGETKNRGEGAGRPVRQTGAKQRTNQGADSRSGAAVLSQARLGENHDETDLSRRGYRRGHAVQLFRDQGGFGAVLFSAGNG